jgi:hypothetical protein
MNRQIQDLERRALAANKAGIGWSDFWPQVSADVAAVTDYYARGRLVHRLVAIVASGDTDGQRPVDGGYSRPFDFELEQIEATR